MALILNIDTAVDTASACLSDAGNIISLSVNEAKNDHASWLHSAIDKMIRGEGLKMGSIEAIAVSIGPGSYTGLRLGLSAAKGMCYSLNIPLITINTLQMMAHSVQQEALDMICPLIDARRMEVFTAVYNKSFDEIVSPSSAIVDKTSFTNILVSHQITFCGNGAKKLQTVLSHVNAGFSDTQANATDLVYFANKHFQEKKFSDLAYCEPLYMKEFYSSSYSH